VRIKELRVKLKITTNKELKIIVLEILETRALPSVIKRGLDVKCTDGVILARDAGLYLDRESDLENWILSRGEERLAQRTYQEYHLL
jgi:hypothetical protein